jgi:hypothetical protein
VSIKGTLDSFNLCELLQMLAFNQKEGTLVLGSEDGGRAIFLDSGRLTFLQQDPHLTASVARQVRHYEDCTPDVLEAAIATHTESGQHLLAVLEAEEVIDTERAALYFREAVLRRLATKSVDLLTTRAAGWSRSQARQWLLHRSSRSL